MADRRHKPHLMRACAPGAVVIEAAKPVGLTQAQIAAVFTVDPPSQLA